MIKMVETFVLNFEVYFIKQPKEIKTKILKRLISIYDQEI